ncbi:ovarian-specific serine/threonine-protein kinase lok [Anaeramoeba ignava]|uniref:Ovarian-specific serine/threonine-protein kinase lok n=1 Tax=Anaeramoeba ignava TaxID=1746090 RepID=A0A9Q0RAX1_ANAIG|nr:ovarian-specific serine/threonine-protein kinase lok [Anaeramoeba ignava]
MYQLKQQNELSPKENGLVPPSRSISLEDFTNISEDVELSFEIDISQKKIFRPKTQSNEKNRKNQDVFAIKSIPIMGYQQFFKNLIPILRLRHPGIIQCELITIKEGQVHLHFPFYSKGNIRQFTEKGTNLKEIFFIIGHVLITLNYIHSQGIYHSNLKPENILITDNLTPVLSDFGNSQNANWKQIFERFPRQNLNLIPPEIFQQKSKVKYDSKADMYSLGVTMKELSKINSDFEKDQNYLEIMESFMEINPDKRPSALQILKTYLDIWGIQMDLQNLISFHNPSHDVFKLYPKKVLSENKLKKSRLEDERKKN